MDLRKKSFFKFKTSFSSAVALLMALFFVSQIVSASVERAFCHSSEEVSDVHTESASSDHSGHSDSECSDVGSCVFGHCHFHHGGVLIGTSSWNELPKLDLNKIKILKDTQKKSIYNLEGPWQPPRWS